MEIKKGIRKIEHVTYKEKEVDVFITKDGKEFFDENLAKDHEAFIIKKEEKEKSEEKYKNIEKGYFDGFPSYSGIEFFKVKNKQDVEAILLKNKNVNSRNLIENNIDILEYPHLIVITTTLEYGYEVDHFETIEDVINEWKPFINFYENLLELKKDCEL